MEDSKTRKATHANSWYPGSESELTAMLEATLSAAVPTNPRAALIKGLIVPHAGYRFSLPTAAYAYAYAGLNPAQYKRVILIGPSHHSYFQGCGLPSCTTYRTPLGDMGIDSALVDSFLKLPGFIQLDQSVEEEEHSLEMQLPLLKKVFGSHEVKLLPLMAGDLGEGVYASIAQALAPFVADKETLFVISSDFCHWGLRYKYMYYDKTKGEIYQSIEDLDRMGMKLIEAHDNTGFVEYLSKYKNTICGRIPILLYITAIRESKFPGVVTTFVHYSQSNKATTIKDFSVSYAAGVTFCS